MARASAVPWEAFVLTGVKIGKGGFGKVVGAQVYGEEVAAKTLHCFRHPELYRLALDSPTYEQLTTEMEQEAALLEQLDHSNVVRVVGIVCNPKTAKCEWLLMERASEGTLDQHLRAVDVLTLPEMWDLTHQLLTGVVFLHAQQPPVLHRDLKPANVLVARDAAAPHGVRYLLADVGLAKGAAAHWQTSRRSQLGCMSVCGTPFYTALDVFTGTGYDGRADVFSIGIMLAQVSLAHVEVPRLPGSRQPAAMALADTTRRTEMVTVALDRLAQLQDGGGGPLHGLVQACTALKAKNRPTAAAALERCSGNVAPGRPAARLPCAAALDTALGAVREATRARLVECARVPGRRELASLSCTVGDVLRTLRQLSTPALDLFLVQRALQRVVPLLPLAVPAPAPAPAPQPQPQKPLLQGRLKRVAPRLAPKCRMTTTARDEQQRLVALCVELWAIPSMRDLRRSCQVGGCGCGCNSGAWASLAPRLLVAMPAALGQALLPLLVFRRARRVFTTQPAVVVDTFVMAHYTVAISGLHGFSSPACAWTSIDALVDALRYRRGVRLTPFAATVCVSAFTAGLRFGAHPPAQAALTRLLRTHGGAAAVAASGGLVRLGCAKWVFQACARQLEREAGPEAATGLTLTTCALALSCANLLIRVTAAVVCSAVTGLVLAQVPAAQRGAATHVLTKLLSAKVAMGAVRAPPTTSADGADAAVPGGVPAAVKNLLATAVAAAVASRAASTAAARALHTALQQLHSALRVDADAVECAVATCVLLREQAGVHAPLDLLQSPHALAELGCLDEDVLPLLDALADTGMRHVHRKHSVYGKTFGCMRQCAAQLLALVAFVGSTAPAAVRHTPRLCRLLCACNSATLVEAALGWPLHPITLLLVNGLCLDLGAPGGLAELLPWRVAVAVLRRGMAPTADELLRGATNMLAPALLCNAPLCARLQAIVGTAGGGGGANPGSGLALFPLKLALAVCTHEQPVTWTHHWVASAAMLLAHCVADMSSEHVAVLIASGFVQGLAAAVASTVVTGVPFGHHHDMAGVLLIALAKASQGLVVACTSSAAVRVACAPLARVIFDACVHVMRADEPRPECRRPPAAVGVDATQPLLLPLHAEDLRCFALEGCKFALCLGPAHGMPWLTSGDVVTAVMAAEFLFEAEPSREVATSLCALTARMWRASEETLGFKALCGDVLRVRIGRNPEFMATVVHEIGSVVAQPGASLPDVQGAVYCADVLGAILAAEMDTARTAAETGGPTVCGELFCAVGGPVAVLRLLDALAASSVRTTLTWTLAGYLCAVLQLIDATPPAHAAVYVPQLARIAAFRRKVSDTFGPM